MSSSAAEKIVKKLARLPSNTVCANCGTMKKFGFSTVCIKYFTFVCNNCKSSHQAISHRCKSLTMSSWTDQEAAELRKKGNDYARRTWLKNAPPVGQGGRPREGDSVDVFKRFVVDAYERKRYFGEDEGNIGAVSARPTHAIAAEHAPRVAAGAPMVARAPVRRAPVRKAVHHPAAAPPPPVAPVEDLLDFTSMPSATTQSGATSNVSATNTFEVNFDTFASTDSVSSSGRSTGTKFTTAAIKNDPFQPTIAHTAAISNSSGGTFKANFDAFAQTTSVPSSGPSATPIENDPFQPNISQATTLNGSNFNFINNKNIAAPLPAPSVPVTTAMKKPVMNNHTFTQKSSLISSMSSTNSCNIQQGGHNLGSGMGWNNNNSNNPNSFGGLGNMNSLQHQTMMQQQQMNMMNGMCMNNSSSMGIGMMGNNNNPMMMMGSNSNPMMMMGNNNNPMMMMRNNNNQMMMMGNNNNQMMMNQQHNMMNGNNFGGMNNNSKEKPKGAMQSLNMNSSSMNAWSSGVNK